jgi:hypothetical protein
MSGEHYHWPMEQDIPKRAIVRIEEALRDWLKTHDYDPDVHNAANHIAAWLQKSPISDIDELLL